MWVIAVTSMNMCGKHIHQENKDMFRSLWFKICWHQLFRGNSTESPLSIKLLSIYRTSGIQLHSRPHPIEAGVDLVVTCLRLEKIDLVELGWTWTGNGGEPRKLLVQKSPKSVGLQRIRFHPKSFCAGIKCSIRKKYLLCIVLWAIPTKRFPPAFGPSVAFGSWQRSKSLRKTMVHCGHCKPKQFCFIQRP